MKKDLFILFKPVKIYHVWFFSYILFMVCWMVTQIHIRYRIYCDVLYENFVISYHIIYSYISYFICSFCDLFIISAFYIKIFFSFSFLKIQILIFLNVKNLLYLMV